MKNVGISIKLSVSTYTNEQQLQAQLWVIMENNNE